MAKHDRERERLYSEVSSNAAQGEIGFIFELIAVYALACAEREKLGEEVTWYQGLEWFAEELRRVKN